MKWISVKDKLPNNYDYVLIFVCGIKTLEPPAIAIATYRQNKWIIPYGIGISCEDLLWNFDNNNISHWMPLPTPPRQNEVD